MDIENKLLGKYMRAKLLVTTRGSLVEAIQRGHIAVVDTQGQLQGRCGDPTISGYMRSTAKPFQAAIALQSGAAERFSLTGPHLAIICGSHYGEPEHVAAVREVLRRADVPEKALQCGIQAPTYQPAAAALWRAGHEPTTIHNTCSGKHAGMLAAAQALGAPLDSYLSSDHPVQQSIITLLRDLTGVPSEHVVYGIDGCAAPTFGLPLQSIARAYAHLADPASVSAHTTQLALISEAMTAYPWYIDGTGGPDATLMECTKGRLIAKTGAEGMLCVGVRDAGLGIAIKIESGRNNCIHAVAIATLAQLGLINEKEIAALHDLIQSPLCNHLGQRVGETSAVVKLHHRKR